MTSDVSLVTHAPRVIAAYLRHGEEGLAAIEAEVEDAAHDQPNGTFSKRRAAYLPQAPVPPTLWRTSCGRCRFWEAGGPGEPGQCHIVGHPGDRWGGEAVHYRGWCGFWMPPEGEPPFAWLRERFAPDGKSTVRGEYDPELGEKRRARQSTEPAARQRAIRGEDGEN